MFARLSATFHIFGVLNSFKSLFRGTYRIASHFWNLHFSCQALDVVRQTKVAQLLAEDVGGASFSTSSVASSSASLNGSGSKTSIEPERDDPNDDKKNRKREKTFSRLKRTLSSRGQKLMEKMGASGTRLQRSSSRDNLAHHAKLSPSERISRSTPMLAQPQPDPDRGRSGSVTTRGAPLGH